MSNIKTAVSIKESLFKEAETLAKKLEISRSKLFAVALENFIRQQENRELLKKINEVHNQVFSPDEESYKKQIRDYHRRSLEDE
jgi:metal-responsive CopG/Arc/MetJ family transcriptional regulator